MGGKEEVSRAQAAALYIPCSRYPSSPRSPRYACRACASAPPPPSGRVYAPCTAWTSKYLSAHTAMGRISRTRAPFGRSGLDPELLADRRGVAHRGCRESKVCGCVVCVFVDTGKSLEERRETRICARRADSLCTNKSSSESLATPQPTSPTVTSVSGPVAFATVGSVLLHRARATSVRYSVQMTPKGLSHQQNVNFTIGDGVGYNLL